MGCCCSSAAKFYDKNPQFTKWRIQFESLRLTPREIQKMYKVFRKVDFDGSGAIGLGELLAHIDVERTKFSERIFSIFDEDGSGEIDFREFVLSLWNYCTLTKATLDMFAFDLYDNDASGELSAKEIQVMLKDIYGKEVKTNVFAKQVLTDIKAIKGDAIFDIQEFRKFVKTHQALLFPAFQMQFALQKKILGKGFWTNNAERRLRLSDGNYISIQKFMEIHVDKELMKKTTEAALLGTENMDKHALLILESTGTRANRKGSSKLNWARESGRGSLKRINSKLMESTKDIEQVKDEQQQKETNALLSSLFHSTAYIDPEKKGDKAEEKTDEVKNSTNDLEGESYKYGQSNKRSSKKSQNNLDSVTNNDKKTRRKSVAVGVVAEGVRSSRQSFGSFGGSFGVTASGKSGNLSLTKAALQAQGEVINKFATIEEGEVSAPQANGSHGRSSRSPNKGTKVTPLDSSAVEDLEDSAVKMSTKVKRPAQRRRSIA